MSDRSFIFVAMEDFQGVWRRNQPVAAGLARRNAGGRVLYVGLDVDVSNLLRRGRIGDLWRQLKAARLTAAPGHPNLHTLKCIKWLPNTVTPFRRFNRRLQRRRVRRAAGSLGIAGPVLWMNPYYAVHLPGRMGESLVVYDVGDDWTQFRHKTARETRQVIDEDAALTRRADLTIVVSQHLFDLKRPQARRLELIPNGVYTQRYTAIAAGKIAPHAMAAAWHRPTLLYTGSVHQERVDLPLLVAVARAYPLATVALVGPDMLTPAGRQLLGAEANVVLAGTVPFDQMPAVMAAADVLIVPHRVTPFTNSLSPLKLYEYLAAGLATVATPVSGFREHPELIRLAGDAPQFIQGVGAALSESVSRRAARQRAAADFSWDARLDAIEAALDKSEAGPAVPSADLPGTEVPSADLPGTDVPSADLPGADLPAEALERSSADARSREASNPRARAAQNAQAKVETDRPDVSVVIVSYNTREITLGCLRALYDDLGDRPAEVFVVDNASGDGSAQAIAAGFPRVICIANPHNNGFGAANNQALRRARGRHLLLLNSDAFVHRGAIGAMIDHLDAHPGVAAVGPRLLNGDGSLQLSCFRLPSPTQAWIENAGLSRLSRLHRRLDDYRRWPHDTPREVEFVSGACFMVPCGVYRGVGGFDEAFFMYSEESDWQNRMRQAGGTIGFIPSAVVTHLGGSSGAAQAARVNRHFFASLDYYQLKHHGRLGLVSLRAAMTLGCGVRAVGWAGMYLVSPRTRSLAGKKLKLMLWLTHRQATHWRGMRRVVTRVGDLQASGASPDSRAPRAPDERAAPASANA